MCSISGASNDDSAIPPLKHRDGPSRDNSCAVRSFTPATDADRILLNPILVENSPSAGTGHIPHLPTPAKISLAPPSESPLSSIGSATFAAVLR